MRLLNNFDQISVVHQTPNAGWEPFDNHNCGHMPLRSFKKCLELIYNKGPLDIDRLNQIYTRTAKKPLKLFSKKGSVGFKMRFTPPGLNLQIEKKFQNIRNSKIIKHIKYKIYKVPFKQLMFNLLKKHNLVVFMAVRQDVLRWALSKYHGDGTGKPGHIQFRLASGEISKDQIGKIHVDCEQLKKTILACEMIHADKRSLMHKLKQAGIKVLPILYEDFLVDKLKYFKRICDALEIAITEEEINFALRRGAYFKRVHSDQISDFVENHQEVMDRFSDRFVSWEEN